MKKMMSMIFSVFLVLGGEALAGDLPTASSNFKNPPAKKLTAKELAELMPMKIRTGTLIRVREYNPQTKLFRIDIVEESAVGPNYTTLTHLQVSRGKPSTIRQMSDPQSWVGQEFKLVEDLRLVKP